MPIWDKYPDVAVGHRIVADDEELRTSQLKLGGKGKGTWSLTFPDKFKVWSKKGGGDYVQVTSGEDSKTVTLPLTLDIKLEGITPSTQENDCTLKAVFTPEGATSIDDTVLLTVYGPEMTSQIINGSPYQQDPENRSSLSNMNSSVAMGVAASPPAHPIENLPPIITFNPKTTRAISLTFPTRFQGKTIRWVINGPSLISKSRGSSFGSTVQTTLGSDRKSTVFLRTGQSGPIRVDVSILQSGQPTRLWTKNPSYAVQIVQLAEDDHQVNHVPNDKWKVYGTNGLAENQKPTMKNTLFYCQEPENGRIELRLQTTLVNGNTAALIKSGHGSYFWRLSGNEEDADNADTVVGFNEYVDKFDSDSKGVGYLQFYPKYNPARPGVSLGGLYTLSLGADSDGDGDADNWVFPSNPDFRVRHISDDQRRTATGKVKYFYASGANALASTVLRVFLYGTGASGSSRYTVPTPTFVPLFASNPSLTHIAGAHFGGASSSANIPKYTWVTGEVDEEFYQSTGLGTHIINALKANQSTIIQAFKKGGAPIKTFPLNWPTVPIPWTYGTIRGVGRGADFDLAAALGHVSIRATPPNSGLRVTIVKRSDGTLAAGRVFISGQVADLTDFDYYGAGPSRNASKVQIGWEGTLRSEGKIFINQTNLLRAFTSADDPYSVVADVTNNYLSTLKP